jgi:hypothetical protein
MSGARLVAENRIGDLLEALAVLASTAQATVAVVVGEGPERAESAIPALVPT